MNFQVFRRITVIIIVILLNNISIFSIRFSEKITNVSDDSLSENILIEQFLKENAFKQLYLVFAGPYPSSPTSAFGHIFVLLEPEEYRPFLTWTTIDFSATTEEVGSFEFFIKGIFGGLVGEYRMNPFYEKYREYTFIESRPLWLFPVELSEKEKKNFLTNIYHFRQKIFPYKFTNTNCASQIDSLLIISFNKTDNSKRLVFFPKTLIDNWIDKIGKPIFIESANNIILENINKLSIDFNEDNIDLTKFSTAEKAILLSFLEWKNSNKSEHLDRTEIDLMKELRLIVSKSEEETINIFKNYNKEFDIHGSILIGGGVKVFSDNSQAFLMKFRFGLHEFFENTTVYPANDYLSLIKADIGLVKNRIFIDELFIFDQLSLQPISYLSKYLSWRIGLGLEKKIEYKNFPIAYGLFGGLGYTISIINNFFNISMLMEVTPGYLQNYGYMVFFGLDLIFNVSFSNRVKLMNKFKFNFNKTNNLDNTYYNETYLGIAISSINIFTMRFKYSNSNFWYSFSLNHYIN